MLFESEPTDEPTNTSTEEEREPDKPGDVRPDPHHLRDAAGRWSAVLALQVAGGTRKGFGG